MNIWLKRIGLSFIVTLGFAAYNKLPAQAPLVPPTQVFDATPSTPLMTVLSRPIEPQAPGNHPRLNSRGYCCDSDINWFGCGGVRSNWDFFFGSCRTFFGEPCVAKQEQPHGHRSGN
jgi:hypothetical protein